jgi:A/G-specific adenine glycosylase
VTRAAAAPRLADQPRLDAEHVRRVQRELLDWYARCGRDLPWRHTRDPYAILVSEVMLQQTQVERVIPKWHAWLARFPTLRALAAAPRAAVIRAWQGLGYNVRAVRLHAIARQAVERFDGALPPSVAELRTLAGVGAYTAGAIACFAFGRPVPMVDTNVRRVLGRVFLGVPAATEVGAATSQRLAAAVLPEGEAYAWNQALMDLGATVCGVARPLCLVCPLLASCRAAPMMGAWRAGRRRGVREAPGPYATSQRYYRGRLIDQLRGLAPGERVALAELGPRLKPDFGAADRPWLEGLARRLAADGLLELVEDDAGPRVSLPD